MTENKRFDVVYEEDDEYKNIRYWEIIDKKCGATTSNELKICHLLNNLNDENEQLKDALNQRTDQCDKYYKENEELKQFKEDVFNEIDMHLRMLPTARDNDDDDSGLYTGAIYMLETLKKELQE